MRNARPVMILALGWIAILLYAYPGQVTVEALACLGAVRTNRYGDCDPPILYALWKPLELVVAGPISLFVVQVVSFSIGAWAILRRTFAPRAAAWAATGLLVFPPILVPMAIIGPHGLLAGLLLLGAAGLLSERPGRRAGGVVALAMASAMHDAALAATLPLLVVLGPWQADRGRWRRLAAAIATWLAITASAIGAGAALSGSRTQHGVIDRSWGERADMAEALLGTGATSPDPMIALNERPTHVMLKRGIPTRSSELQDALVDGMRVVAETPIFLPWIYLVLAVVLVPLARRHRDVLALVVSGVLFELTLVMTATSPAFAQSHWMIVCTCIAIVVLAARRAKPASPDQ